MEAKTQLHLIVCKRTGFSQLNFSFFYPLLHIAYLHKVAFEQSEEIAPTEQKLFKENIKICF